MTTQEILLTFILPMVIVSAFIWYLSRMHKQLLTKLLTNKWLCYFGLVLGIALVFFHYGLVTYFHRDYFYSGFFPIRLFGLFITGAAISQLFRISK